ncbi:hypothetical protein KKG31_02715, partial [Patescibacteria group bacterium]|nr:hypothetical protein [Patescibacteria group bacterium]MBU1758073.1 hypothetical protein [Patescibacteria group bacterium]
SWWRREPAHVTYSIGNLPERHGDDTGRKRMLSSQSFMYWIPKLADIFIFTYPVYFVVLYFRKKVQRWKVAKEERKSSILKDTSSFSSQQLTGQAPGGQIKYKMVALFVAASALFAFIANIIIQFFVDKVRPHIVLGLADKKTETILHKFLPASSFPSDHAALSMAIAMGTLVW